MATINQGWSTSFIYKQDLTSYYMNNVLKSVIRPGIYNANIAVTKGKSSRGSAGENDICIIIKKGTTFVFSNDYVFYPVLGYRRNFNAFETGYSDTISDNENSCMIKCTAISDFKIGLGNVGKGLWSIHAFIRYQPTDLNNLDTSSPSFLLVGNSNSFDQTEPLVYDVHAGDGTISLRYTSELEKAGVIAYGGNLILDGETKKPSDMPYGFYLNIGFIKVEGEGNSPTLFTGRGLPEYRMTSSFDSDTLCPDIIPNMVGDTVGIFADIPNSLIGTVFFDGRMTSKDTTEEYLNWEGAYFPFRKGSDPHITFDANGVYAVYGLVSNIKSFGKNSTPGVSDVAITFDKLSLDISLNPSDGTPWGGSSSTSTESTESEPKIPKIIPLDVSPLNVRSLLSSIKNKDIWSYVIDKVRESKNPNSITDIVPLGIVTVEGGKINPMETLSYSGAQVRTPGVNVINVREHNIFNVVPVME